MVVVRVDSEQGSAYWMNGTMPDGEGVYALLRSLGLEESVSPDIHERDRTHFDVRNAYSRVLHTAYSQEHPDRTVPEMILLRNVPRASGPTPLACEMQLAGPDHLILLGDQEIKGEEFMFLVRGNYGFESPADLSSMELEGTMCLWRDWNHKAEVVTPEAVFALAARELMDPFLEMRSDVHRQAQKYFSRLGLRTD